MPIAPWRGIDADRGRKRHKPSTNRRNRGDDYHGCLVITVPRSRRLYVRTEGLMAGVFGAFTSR